MVENGYAETKARLGTDQLWLLLAHILHFQAIYELAKLRLRPELFNGRDEAGMRLLWQVVLQADAAGAAGQFFTNKPYAWNYLTAEAKQYAESHPEDLAPEFYDLLFGQSPLGLLPWIYNGVGGNEMGESWGRQLLADFLTERYVEDPLRRAVESSSGMVLQNLPTLLQEATDRRSEVASISEDVAQLAWKEGYSPQPLVTFSTGVGFLDPFLRGGHANGEVYGVLGAYGSGKSSLALQLAVGGAKVERLAEASDPAYQLRYAFVFFYEGSNDLWHQRLISHAAQIHFDTASTWGRWDICHPSTMGQLKPYELDHWRDEIEENGGPHQTLGERERFELFIPQVRRNIFLCDMTGPKGKPKQGTGYVQEIAAAVAAQTRKGKPPCVVVIDYAGLCARRHRNETGLPDTSLRHLVGEFGFECERQIATPFNCPVWIMHQLSGEANTRTHSTRQHHADAAEAKNFAENVWFCFNLGTKDPVHGSILMTVTKARRSGLGRPPRLCIDGGLTTLKRATHLVEDARGRVHSRAEFEQTHGYNPDEALFDQEEMEVVA